MSQRKMQRKSSPKNPDTRNTHARARLWCAADFELLAHLDAVVEAKGSPRTRETYTALVCEALGRSASAVQNARHRRPYLHALRRAQHLLAARTDHRPLSPGSACQRNIDAASSELNSAFSAANFSNCDVRTSRRHASSDDGTRRSSFVQFQSEEKLTKRVSFQGDEESSNTSSVQNVGKANIEGSRKYTEINKKEAEVDDDLRGNETGEQVKEGNKLDENTAEMKGGYISTSQNVGNAWMKDILQAFDGLLGKTNSHKENYGFTEEELANEKHEKLESTSKRLSCESYDTDIDENSLPAEKREDESDKHEVLQKTKKKSHSKLANKRIYHALSKLGKAEAAKLNLHEGVEARNMPEEITCGSNSQHDNSSMSKNVVSEEFDATLLDITMESESEIEVNSPRRCNETRAAPAETRSSSNESVFYTSPLVDTEMADDETNEAVISMKVALNDPQVVREQSKENKRSLIKGSSDAKKKRKKLSLNTKQIRKEGILYVRKYVPLAVSLRKSRRKRNLPEGKKYVLEECKEYISPLSAKKSNSEILKSDSKAVRSIDEIVDNSGRIINMRTRPENVPTERTTDGYEKCEENSKSSEPSATESMHAVTISPRISKNISLGRHISNINDESKLESNSLSVSSKIPSARKNDVQTSHESRGDLSLVVRKCRKYVPAGKCRSASRDKSEDGQVKHDGLTTEILDKAMPSTSVGKSSVQGDTQAHPSNVTAKNRKMCYPSLRKDFYLDKTKTSFKLNNLKKSKMKLFSSSNHIQDFPFQETDTSYWSPNKNESFRENLYTNQKRELTSNLSKSEITSFSSSLRSSIRSIHSTPSKPEERNSNVDHPIPLSYSLEKSKQLDTKEDSSEPVDLAVREGTNKEGVDRNTFSQLKLQHDSILCSTVNLSRREDNFACGKNKNNKVNSQFSLKVPQNETSDINLGLKFPFHTVNTEAQCMNEPQKLDEGKWNIKVVSPRHMLNVVAPQDDHSKKTCPQSHILGKRKKFIQTHFPKFEKKSSISSFPGGKETVAPELNKCRKNELQFENTSDCSISIEREPKKHKKQEDTEKYSQNKEDKGLRKSYQPSEIQDSMYDATSNNGLLGKRPNSLDHNKSHTLVVRNAGPLCGTESVTVRMGSQNAPLVESTSEKSCPFNSEGESAPFSPLLSCLRNHPHSVKLGDNETHFYIEESVSNKQVNSPPPNDGINSNKGVLGRGSNENGQNEKSCQKVIMNDSELLNGSQNILDFSTVRNHVGVNNGHENGHNSLRKPVEKDRFFTSSLPIRTSKQNVEERICDEESENNFELPITEFPFGQPLEEVKNEMDEHDNANLLLSEREKMSESIIREENYAEGEQSSELSLKICKETNELSMRKKSAERQFINEKETLFTNRMERGEENSITIRNSGGGGGRKHRASDLSKRKEDTNVLMQSSVIDPQIQVDNFEGSNLSANQRRIKGGESSTRGSRVISNNLGTRKRKSRRSLSFSKESVEERESDIVNESGLLETDEKVVNRKPLKSRRLTYLTEGEDKESSDLNNFNDLLDVEELARPLPPEPCQDDSKNNKIVKIVENEEEIVIIIPKEPDWLKKLLGNHIEHSVENSASQPVSIWKPYRNPTTAEEISSQMIQDTEKDILPLFEIGTNISHSENVKKQCASEESDALNLHRMNEESFLLYSGDEIPDIPSSTVESGSVIQKHAHCEPDHSYKKTGTPNLCGQKTMIEISKCQNTLSNIETDRVKCTENACTQTPEHKETFQDCPARSCDRQFQSHQNTNSRNSLCKDGQRKEEFVASFSSPTMTTEYSKHVILERGSKDNKEVKTNDFTKSFEIISVLSSKTSHCSKKNRENTGENKMFKTCKEDESFSSFVHDDLSGMNTDKTTDRNIVKTCENISPERETNNVSVPTRCHKNNTSGGKRETVFTTGTNKRKKGPLYFMRDGKRISKVDKERQSYLVKSKTLKPGSKEREHWSQTGTVDQPVSNNEQPEIQVNQKARIESEEVNGTKREIQVKEHVRKGGLSISKFLSQRQCWRSTYLLRNKKRSNSFSFKKKRGLNVFRPSLLSSDCCMYVPHTSAAANTSRRSSCLFRVSQMASLQLRTKKTRKAVSAGVSQIRKRTTARRIAVHKPLISTVSSLGNMKLEASRTEDQLVIDSETFSKLNAKGCYKNRRNQYTSPVCKIINTSFDNLTSNVLLNTKESVADIGNVCEAVINKDTLNYDDYITVPIENAFRNTEKKIITQRMGGELRVSNCEENGSTNTTRKDVEGRSVVNDHTYVSNSRIETDYDLYRQIEGDMVDNVCEDVTGQQEQNQNTVEHTRNIQEVTHETCEIQKCMDGEDIRYFKQGYVCKENLGNKFKIMQAVSSEYMQADGIMDVSKEIDSESRASNNVTDITDNNACGGGTLHDNMCLFRHEVDDVDVIGIGHIINGENCVKDDCHKVFRVAENDGRKNDTINEDNEDITEKVPVVHENDHEDHDFDNLKDIDGIRVKEIEFEDNISPVCKWYNQNGEEKQERKSLHSGNLEPLHGNCENKREKVTVGSENNTDNVSNKDTNQNMYIEDDEKTCDDHVGDLERHNEGKDNCIMNGIKEYVSVEARGNECPENKHTFNDTHAKDCNKYCNDKECNRKSNPVCDNIDDGDGNKNNILFIEDVITDEEADVGTNQDKNTIQDFNRVEESGKAAKFKNTVCYEDSDNVPYNESNEYDSAIVDNVDKNYQNEKKISNFNRKYKCYNELRTNGCGIYSDNRTQNVSVELNESDLVLDDKDRGKRFRDILGNIRTQSDNDEGNVNDIVEGSVENIEIGCDMIYFDKEEGSKNIDEGGNESTGNVDEDIMFSGCLKTKDSLEIRHGNDDETMCEPVGKGYFECCVQDDTDATINNGSTCQNELNEPGATSPNSNRTFSRPKSGRDKYRNCQHLYVTGKFVSGELINLRENHSKIQLMEHLMKSDELNTSNDDKNFRNDQIQTVSHKTNYVNESDKSVGFSNSYRRMDNIQKPVFREYIGDKHSPIVDSLFQSYLEGVNLFNVDSNMPPMNNAEIPDIDFLQVEKSKESSDVNIKNASLFSFKGCSIPMASELTGFHVYSHREYFKLFYLPQCINISECRGISASTFLRCEKYISEDKYISGVDLNQRNANGRCRTGGDNSATSSDFAEPNLTQIPEKVFSSDITERKQVRSHITCKKRSNKINENGITGSNYSAEKNNVEHNDLQRTGHYTKNCGSDPQGRNHLAPDFDATTHNVGHSQVKEKRKLHSHIPNIYKCSEVNHERIKTNKINSTAKSSEKVKTYVKNCKHDIVSESCVVDTSDIQMNQSGGQTEIKPHKSKKVKKLVASEPCVVDTSDIHMNQSDRHLELKQSKSKKVKNPEPSEPWVVDTSDVQTNQSVGLTELKPQKSKKVRKLDASQPHVDEANSKQMNHSDRHVELKQSKSKKVKKLEPSEPCVNTFDIQMNQSVGLTELKPQKSKKVRKLDASQPYVDEANSKQMNQSDRHLELKQSKSKKVKNPEPSEPWVVDTSDVQTNQSVGLTELKPQKSKKVRKLDASQPYVDQANSKQMNQSDSHVELKQSKSKNVKKLEPSEPCVNTFDIQMNQSVGLTELKPHSSKKVRKLDASQPYVDEANSKQMNQSDRHVELKQSKSKNVKKLEPSESCVNTFDIQMNQSVGLTELKPHSSKKVRKLDASQPYVDEANSKQMNQSDRHLELKQSKSKNVKKLEPSEPCVNTFDIQMNQSVGLTELKPQKSKKVRKLDASQPYVDEANSKQMNQSDRHLELKQSKSKKVKNPEPSEPWVVDTSDVQTNQSVGLTELKPQKSKKVRKLDASQPHVDEANSKQMNHSDRHVELKQSKSKKVKNPEPSEPCVNTFDIQMNQSVGLTELKPQKSKKVRKLDASQPYVDQANSKQMNQSDSHVELKQSKSKNVKKLEPSEPCVNTFDIQMNQSVGLTELKPHSSKKVRKLDASQPYVDEANSKQMNQSDRHVELKQSKSKNVKKLEPSESCVNTFDIQMNQSVGLTELKPHSSKKVRKLDASQPYVDEANSKQMNQSDRHLELKQSKSKNVKKLEPSEPCVNTFDIQMNQSVGLTELKPQKSKKVRKLDASQPYVDEANSKQMNQSDRHLELKQSKSKKVKNPEPSEPWVVDTSDVQTNQSVGLTELKPHSSKKVRKLDASQPHVDEANSKQMNHSDRHVELKQSKSKKVKNPEPSEPCVNTFDIQMNQSVGLTELKPQKSKVRKLDASQPNVDEANSKQMNQSDRHAELKQSKSKKEKKREVFEPCVVDTSDIQMNQSDGQTELKLPKSKKVKKLEVSRPCVDTSVTQMNQSDEQTVLQPHTLKKVKKLAACQPCVVEIPKNQKNEIDEHAELTPHISKKVKRPSASAPEISSHALKKVKKLADGDLCIVESPNVQMNERVVREKRKRHKSKKRKSLAFSHPCITVTSNIQSDQEDGQVEICTVTAREIKQFNVSEPRSVGLSETSDKEMDESNKLVQSKHRKVKKEMMDSQLDSLENSASSNIRQNNERLLIKLICPMIKKIRLGCEQSFNKRSENPERVFDENYVRMEKKLVSSEKLKSWPTSIDINEVDLNSFSSKSRKSVSMSSDSAETKSDAVNRKCLKTQGEYKTESYDV